MKKSTKENVLEALLETSDYVSGEELSTRFGVSRTSIWKHIKKLKEEGYSITSVTNKGYSLIENPSGIVESLLNHDLSMLGIDTVRVYDTIDSTNLEAKRQASKGVKSGLFIAREQTLGKGRRGRQWVSSKDSGIYMSLLLRPNIEPRKASMLTLLAGLAVKKSIQEAYGLEARIKWPNDLVIGKRKVCGILTEMNAEIDYLNYVVIGIGINMTKQVFSEDIQEIATSLSNELQFEIHSDTYETFIVTIAKYIVTYMKQLEIKGDLSFIKADYESACLNVSGELKIEARDETYTCQGLGINELGELLVEKTDGTVKAVYSGEVSVRGLYGYV